MLFDGSCGKPIFKLDNKRKSLSNYLTSYCIAIYIISSIMINACSNSQYKQKYHTWKNSLLTLLWNMGLSLNMPLQAKNYHLPIVQKGL